MTCKCCHAKAGIRPFYSIQSLLDHKQTLTYNELMIVMAFVVLLSSQKVTNYPLPDTIPIFRFLKEFPAARKPNYSPYSHTGPDQVWIQNPGWQYAFNKSGPDVAHRLKQILNKHSGWELAFPDTKQYWQFHGVHKTKGKPDWHIELIGVKTLAVLDIWDESRAMPPGLYWPPPFH